MDYHVCAVFLLALCSFALGYLIGRGVPVKGYPSRPAGGFPLSNQDGISLQRKEITLYYELVP